MLRATQLLLAALLFVSACAGRRTEELHRTPASDTPRGASSAHRSTATNSRPLGLGRLVFETQSQYSHLKVVDDGGSRTLLFVHGDGTEVVQSRIRLERPYELDVSYTRVMFTSFLFRPVQRRCLLIGLGGGAMVRFLNHHFPDIEVDVVEIDPTVVEVAEHYFGVRPARNLRIITADGLEYLRGNVKRYDVIYLDAFLAMSSQTDSTGAPLQFRTAQFFGSLRRQLSSAGLVVTNLHRRPTTSNDIAQMRAAFSTVHVFPVPNTGNIIVVASLDTRLHSPSELKRQGRQLDERINAGFRFEHLASLEER